MYHFNPRQVFSPGAKKPEMRCQGGDARRTPFAGPQTQGLMEKG